MVVVTGDTHGNFQRLYSRKYKSLNNGDYVLICGDFGGVWHDCERQDAVLDSLDNLPFTVLFADGNHENYDLLNQFPVQQWNGGQVHVIRPNVLHLMRGNVFEIEQKSFFVMGGAASHDLWNGVYDPEHPDHEKYDALYRDGEFFRIKGLSWWEQELPTDEEINQAWDALCAHEKKIDYVISHCAPTELQSVISQKKQDDSYQADRLTDFLQKVYSECSFRSWYCGHYHCAMKVGKLNVLYENCRTVA